MERPKYRGSCLCAAVTYETSGSPEKVFACYCNDCSSNAGGPYQIVAKYDKSQIKVYDPQNCSKVYIINKTASGKDKHKVFCGRCGCTLWTIPQLHNGDKLILRTALLGEGFFDLKPDAEFFDTCRPDFVPSLGTPASFKTMPGY